MISLGSRSRYNPKVVAAFVETISDASQKVSGIPDMPVKSEEMEIGMVLWRDLITPSGLLMPSSGHVLDARMIVQIKNFERTGGLELTVYLRQNP